MKIKKSLLSVCLCISLMFGSLVPSITVYASNNPLKKGSDFLRDSFKKVVSVTSGIITDSVEYTKDFIQWLTDHKSDYDIPNDTSPEDWLDDNISVDSNGNVIMSDNVINSMRDCINNYIVNDTGYVYAYSYKPSELLNLFSNQEKYEAFVDFVSDNAGNVVMSSSSGSYMYLPHDELSNVGYVKTGFKTNYQLYTVSIYNNWENFKFDEYSYNSTNNKYELTSSNYSNSSSSAERLLKYSADQVPTLGSFMLVQPTTTQYIIYNSLSSLQNASVGVQDYYVTDAFNTSHITGSYNTTTNDINNAITYSNVSDYVNNYYVENGSYPTTTIINNYINNYTGGGGSGGDDDNKPDWDFSFLGTIGEFLASLISALGELIGGILSGLTAVIDGLREGFPNVIGSLIEYFLPFLPEEIITLISLSILFAIILGIVKIIRG